MKKIILLLIIFHGCLKPDLPPNPYYALFNSHKVTGSSYYKNHTGWTNTIANITPEHRDYIEQMNRIDGFNEIPRESTTFTTMENRLKSLDSSFPKEIQLLLNRYVKGVYFCENLGGTGISGIVYEGNRPVGGFIILDSSMIAGKKANDWITAKENSVFTSTVTNLKIEIESGAGNNYENALRYIFLHEFGHIVAVVSGQVPDFREKTRDFSKFPFSKNIWKTENDSIYDNAFSLRKKIHFYSDKKISLDDHWKEIYPVLEQTRFPTLYSSIHPDEFFADSFVSYVHVLIDKRPWKLVLTRDNRHVYQYQNNILKNKIQTDILKEIIQKK